MAKKYRLSRAQRMGNKAFAMMTNHGWGASYRHILTVLGRRSGELRSTPVDVMTIDGRLYLVAPYGDVNWVRNVRAARDLSLSRAHEARTYAAEEVHGVQAVPILRKYLHDVPVTRAYWDVTEKSPDAAFAAEAQRHPVFQLTPRR